MSRYFFIIIFSSLLLLAAAKNTHAQCALCKSSAESSLKEGDTQAKGLNAGIMYLLMMPYLLVGGLGYYWYTNNKKQESNRDADSPGEL